jgi:predicted transcriptional regulator
VELIMTRLPGDSLDKVDDRPSLQLTTTEDADLAEAEAEIARGELATADEVRAMWKKHGL